MMKSESIEERSVNIPQEVDYAPARRATRLGKFKSLIKRAAIATKRGVRQFLCFTSSSQQQSVAEEENKLVVVLADIRDDDEVSADEASEDEEISTSTLAEVSEDEEVPTFVEASEEEEAPADSETKTSISSVENTAASTSIALFHPLPPVIKPEMIISISSLNEDLANDIFYYTLNASTIVDLLLKDLELLVSFDLKKHTSRELHHARPCAFAPYIFALLQQSVKTHSSKEISAILENKEVVSGLWKESKESALDIRLVLLEEENPVVSADIDFDSDDVFCSDVSAGSDVNLEVEYERECKKNNDFLPKDYETSDRVYAVGDTLVTDPEFVDSVPIANVSQESGEETDEESDEERVANGEEKEEGLSDMLDEIEKIDREIYMNKRKEQIREVHQIKLKEKKQARFQQKIDQVLGSRIKNYLKKHANRITQIVLVKNINQETTHILLKASSKPIESGSEEPGVFVFHLFSSFDTPKNANTFLCSSSLDLFLECIQESTPEAPAAPLQLVSISSETLELVVVRDTIQAEKAKREKEALELERISYASLISDIDLLIREVKKQIAIKKRKEKKKLKEKQEEIDAFARDLFSEIPFDKISMIVNEFPSLKPYYDKLLKSIPKSVGLIYIGNYSLCNWVAPPSAITPASVFIPSLPSMIKKFKGNRKKECTYKAIMSSTVPTRLAKMAMMHYKDLLLHYNTEVLKKLEIYDFPNIIPIRRKTIRDIQASLNECVKAACRYIHTEAEKRFSNTLILLLPQIKEEAIQRRVKSIFKRNRNILYNYECSYPALVDVYLGFAEEEHKSTSTTEAQPSAKDSSPSSGPSSDEKNGSSGSNNELQKDTAEAEAKTDAKSSQGAPLSASTAQSDASISSPPRSIQEELMSSSIFRKRKAAADLEMEKNGIEVEAEEMRQKKTAHIASRYMPTPAIATAADMDKKLKRHL